MSRTLKKGFIEGHSYFGVIESTKKWIEESHPSLGGHWSHFIAGALGYALGSFIYIPCEVIKQRMQIQGTRKYWSSVAMKSGAHNSMHMYDYYIGMFQAGSSIWKDQGLKGLYAGNSHTSPSIYISLKADRSDGFLMHACFVGTDKVRRNSAYFKIWQDIPHRCL